MRKLLLALALVLSFSMMAFSQTLQPVSWSFHAEKTADGEYELIFTADVDNGWSIYSQDMEEGGPIPTAFSYDVVDGLELLGKAAEEGKRKEAYDELFGMDVIKLSGKTVFRQKMKTIGDLAKVTGFLTFMTCDDERCLPPTDVDFEIALP